MLLINQRMVNGAVKCNKCGKLIAKVKDIHAHHIKEITPENVHDANISLNPDNIELICRNCHDVEHNRFVKVEKKVYLVYGPPLSGKTTFVRNNMHRGDIIVDIDMLYAAVSGLPFYDKPDNLLNNVFIMHNELLDNIKTRYGKWHNAWIVGGYADKFKRERLADELGAELIYCDLSKEECIARLKSDEDRRYRQDEWIKYIDRWYERYTE